VVEAAEVAAPPGLPGEALYNLACVYSQASAAAQRDAKLPPADRDRRAEQYAARAVELLGLAHKDSFFKPADTVQHLKKDPDLDPLRQRADYGKLMATIEGK
jgi:hypothetical protein